jgi:hypothetical protein
MVVSRVCALFGLLALLSAVGAAAQDAAPAAGLLELRFTPVKRAQLAIWIERADGTFQKTLRLTEAVSMRGIGNRPGASQMNSGFRWPYGRREGVLPIWAARRAAAPDAALFKRVIFQDRRTEGLASRTSNDQSRDDYYCLSFDRTRSAQEALDAVSCASPFNSDKGRFVTEADLKAGYAEPYEDLVTGEAHMSTLDLWSGYPPRRDHMPCTGQGCFEHPDAAEYGSHVRDVMPDIDAVTMATPKGGEEQSILFQLPSEWPPGEYRVFVEANTEGDYNAMHNAAAYPTPREPADAWDSWATGYGYPYRGQPSVLYEAPFTIGGEELQIATARDPVGSSGWDREHADYSTPNSMDGMTDAPVESPGSGADRLLLREDDSRLTVVVRPPLDCMSDAAPSQIEELKLDRHDDVLHAHEWAELSFRAAEDDQGIHRYEVRFSLLPITDEASFMHGTPAKEASLDAAELRVPTDALPGERIRVAMGGLSAQTHYFIGVRAIDDCATGGAIATAEYETPSRTFTTVTPCFIASAAHGSPLAAEVGVLRRLRDRLLLSHGPGRAVVHAYYRLGPYAAQVVRGSEGLRDIVRAMLRPVVFLAEHLDPDSPA